jgi:hypothetical protein
MLFDVEEDLGHRIVGYLVPDSYSVGATIKVIANGREMAVLEANQIRSSVVSAGRHSTGHCGFVLTEENVPNLARTSCLEIRDSDSGLTIYRRRPADSVVQSKLFRFEARYDRSASLDQALEKFFQLSFADVDRWGRETTAQSFLLRSSASIYISARLLYREYEYSIDNSFRKVCFLQDPYCELAETILALSRDGINKTPSLSLREELAFGACADYVSKLDLSDLSEMRRGLSRMPQEVEMVFANPLARALGARTSDDTPNATYVSASLASLSSFDIVGIRERPESFLAPLAELLELESGLLPSIATASNAAREMAEILRKLPSVSALVDMDLEIYEAVRGAVRTNF